MRAITLTQPWASLVAIGAKKIETRSWMTRYRGPLLIHAAKGMNEEAQEACLDNEHINRALRKQFNIPPSRAAERLPRGCFLAVVDLVDCFRFYSKGTSGCGWRIDSQDFRQPSGFRTIAVSNEEYCFGDFSLGRWGWQLENVQPLPSPVFCKGELGLWTPPADALSTIDCLRSIAEGQGALAL